MFVALADGVGVLLTDDELLDDGNGVLSGGAVLADVGPRVSPDGG